ncbi:MAG: hypothetical protein WAL72_36795 [Streptosporangiaceae bacterium]
MRDIPWEPRLSSRRLAADTDPDRAKATARQRVADRLGQPGTYAATMARRGYTAREITEVSDRLVDGILAAALIVRFVRTGGIAMLRMMGGSPDSHDHMDAYVSHTH